tara:strand:- start:28262 stop:28480 length:219 start_codon:yes stop_codon:yes gene_type:complete
MKLRTKDEIITCLIEMLSNPVSMKQKDCLICEGWIESLKWVLGLNDEEEKIYTEGKNTLVVESKHKEIVSKH